MLIRLLIILVLFPFVARAVSQLVGGILDGLRGEPPSRRTPARSVQMVRDPVCGTFVVPDRALSITVGHQPVYFCSNRCRDQYRARTA